jgi:hypothetical protein
VALILVAIVAVGFGLRARVAANPGSAYLSSDEYGYVTVAQALSREGTYGTGGPLRLRWPPAAPVMFAVADKISPGTTRPPDIPLAYWFQALLGTGTIVAAFGIGALIAGPLPGLVAAAGVALYPPFVFATGELLSEPLGAFLLASAILALLWALRARSLLRYAVAGVVFGLAILARADFLILPPLLALLVVAAERRRLGTRRAVAQAAVLAAAAGLTVLPWSISVSRNAGRLVPVTTGDAPQLFIGTCLPCKGTTPGAKLAYGDAARAWARDPKYRDVPRSKLPASVVLAYIASRHPGLERDAALRKAAIENLRYDLSHPGQYAELTYKKVRRMWWKPSRMGREATPGWLRVGHGLLLVAVFGGLAAGLWRARQAVGLWVVAVTVIASTALHGLLVTQPRYNVPLLPLLMAAGAAGCALAWRAWRDARAAQPAGQVAVAGGAGAEAPRVPPQASHTS